MRNKELFELDKKIIHYGGLLIYYYRRVFKPQIFKALKKNKELFNKKKSDTLVICGLGPSLALVNLDYVFNSDADVMVVNGFTRFDKEGKYKPTYYLMADGNYLAIEKQKAELINILNKYKESAFILSSQIYHDEAVQNTICDKFVISGFRGRFSAKSKLDIVTTMPATGNSVCIGMLMAMALNYKKIILLGCDFNSFASTKDSHCYSLGRNKPRFLPLSLELYEYSFIADMHVRLSQYAKNKGIEIINATRGSLIDAYIREEPLGFYKDKS